MGNVLAFCESSGDKLRTSALANIAFARQAAEKHGGEVIALLIGASASAAGGEAAKYAGKVITVDDDALGSYLAETYAPIVARIA
ncbi:MAG: electron transfer flavoprotein subunit alpha/FixB family protein, partial [Myxococcota bacterium]